MDDTQLATLSRRFDQIKTMIDSNKINYLTVLNALEKLATESVGFEQWMALTVHQYSSDLNYRQIVKHAGIGFTDKAAGPLYELTRLPPDTLSTISLTLVTLEMLGIHRDADYDYVCERAAAQGLLLCAPRVGPELRMAYQTQPKGSRIVVMSELIGRSTVFTLDHKVKAITLGCASHSSSRPLIITQNDKLVFTLPAK